MKNICYINAGAGSGKTFRLTKELTNYLLEKGVKPSEVILTTFTDLAASEFKEKARQAILASPKGTKKQRIELATEMEAAAIGTVHGIALNFIQRYWYFLNLGADIQVMSPNDQAFYLNQSLTDVLSNDDISTFLKYEEQFCGHDENDGLKNWQEYLRDIITKMDYYDVTQLDQSKDLSKKTLKKLFSGSSWNEQIKKEFDDLFHKKIIFLEGRNNQMSLNKIKTIKGNLNYVQNYRQFISLLTIVENATKTFKKTLSSEELGLWESFSSYTNSQSYLPFLENLVERMFNIADCWDKKYTAFKEKHHMLSYNDMELLLLELLEHNDDFRQEIRDRYKLLMVDEFQDSNSIQLKIFNILSELIAENGGQTIWVGDPKQSIYSFRGANIDLITSVTRVFEQPNLSNGLSSDNLPESWRSRKSLVDVVNQVFTRVFTPKEFPNRKQITLKAHFSDDLDSNSLREWRLAGKNEEVRLKGLAYQVEQLVASGLQVKSKGRDKTTRTITYKDIAILAYKKVDVYNIAKALRQRGLPVECSEKDILQRKEVQLVKTLLAYCTEPWNVHLKADLAYMLQDETTEELFNDRSTYLNGLGSDQSDQWKSDDAFLEPINDLCKRIYKLSITEIVTSIINELNLYAISQKWGEANIRHQNLNTLIDLAKTYDERCQQMGLGATILGYLNYLQTTNIEPVQDNLSNTIKVLTYHSSKGLEWPVVILYSLETGIDNQQNILKKGVFGVNEQQVDHEVDNPFDKHYHIHLLPHLVGKNNNLPKSFVGTLTSEDMYPRIRERTISESKRLLYVGMTRARDYLIATYQKGSSLKWLIDIGIAPSDNSCWGISHDSDIITIDVNDMENQLPTPSKTYFFVPKPNNRTERSDKYLSPSKLETNDDKLVAIKITDHISPVIPRSNWQEMSQIGTCIHNIFAIYQPGNNNNEDNAQRIIKNFGLVNELGNIASQIQEAIHGLYEYLTNHYGPAESIEKEMPFYHRIEGHIIHGEMDMVWNYRKDNQLHSVLIDYKTFPGNHSILGEYSKEYIPQLRAYKEALEAGNRHVESCLIFYAVQGSIAEVKI